MTTHEAICRALCRASVNTPQCPYCERGECQPVMWKTFAREATAVITTLAFRGELKKSDAVLKGQLPGLGG